MNALDNAAVLIPSHGEKAWGERPSGHPSPGLRRWVCWVRGFRSRTRPQQRRADSAVIESRLSYSFSLEGEGWDEGGCRPQQPRRVSSNPHRDTRSYSAPARKGPEKGSSSRDRHPSNHVRTQSNSGRPALHPLRGERQIPPSSAEIGEGSSAQPASGHAGFSCDRRSE